MRENQEDRDKELHIAGDAEIARLRAELEGSQTAYRIQLAEVERLREELNQCHSDAGFVIPALREALAAHQAVVRSLETALWRLIHSIWPCPEPKHGDECARCDAERRLADPLVVAARTEGRG